MVQFFRSIYGVKNNNTKVDELNDFFKRRFISTNSSSNYPTSQKVTTTPFIQNTTSGRKRPSANK